MYYEHKGTLPHFTWNVTHCLNEQFSKLIQGIVDAARRINDVEVLNVTLSLVDLFTWKAAIVNIY
jgi:hypothetical protein